MEIRDRLGGVGGCSSAIYSNNSITQYVRSTWAYENDINKSDFIILLLV